MLSLFRWSRNQPTPPHQTDNPAAILAAALPIVPPALVAQAMQETSSLAPRPLFDLKIHKEVNDNSREATLKALLDNNDLLELLNSKSNALREVKGEVNVPLTEKIIYDYINGICDLAGKPKDISIPAEIHETFISQIRQAAEGNSAIQVSLQAGPFEKPLESDLAGQRALFRPLDVYLMDESNQKKFSSLSEKHKTYIHSTANENYAGISKDMHEGLMRMEKELLEELRGENISIFRTCIKHANLQNVAPKGFIHFRQHPARGAIPAERIYIKVNKDRAYELVKVLLSTFYVGGLYQGILDIKVSGPQMIGRTDGIVIYIGEVSRERELSEEAKQRAIKEREAIIAKLKEIQRQDSTLFANSSMPFKEVQAPGIATIPGLSSTESFTNNLSKALALALPRSGDVATLRENTIKAFLEEPWMRGR